MTLTEYDDVRPIVRVHAARVFMDHEKLGFFRLGLVPLAVVQGVQVQIESARRLTNALANLSAWNRSPGSLRHLEFRDLEFSLLSDTEPRLRAVTARVDDAGGLELSRVVVAGGPSQPLARATLQITGPDASRLRWRDGEKQAELLLFKPTEP